MPLTQLFVKETELSAIKRMERRTLATIMGLKTFNSKWPLLPPIVTATLFPITCAATIVIASHCVGLTFPVVKN